MLAELSTTLDRIRFPKSTCVMCRRRTELIGLALSTTQYLGRERGGRQYPSCSVNTAKLPHGRHSTSAHV